MNESPAIFRFKIDKEYWTLYNFIEGNHYSGKFEEFINTSYSIGLLYKNLYKLDIKNQFSNGPNYYNYKNKI